MEQKCNDVLVWQDGNVRPRVRIRVYDDAGRTPTDIDCTPETAAEVAGAIDTLLNPWRADWDSLSDWQSIWIYDGESVLMAVIEPPGLDRVRRLYAIGVDDEEPSWEGAFVDPESPGALDNLCFKLRHAPRPPQTQE